MLFMRIFLQDVDKPSGYDIQKVSCKNIQTLIFPNLFSQKLAL